MKKILILLISAVITISASVNAFAYTDMSSTYETKILESLGIMNGDSDGSFNPERTITRAEAAKMIAQLSVGASSLHDTLANYGLTGKQLAFSDIPENHWAYESILWTSSMGIMNGFDDGTFRPNDKVTYVQLIKMLDTILGYTTYAELNGGYPDGYILYARKIGLLSGISSFSNDDYVTRGDAAKLMGAALDIPVVVVTQNKAALSQGEKKPELKILNGEGKDYQTLLTMQYNAYIVTGKVIIQENGETYFQIMSSKNFDNEYYNSSSQGPRIALNYGEYSNSVFNGESCTLVIQKTGMSYNILCRLD